MNDQRTPTAGVQNSEAENTKMPEKDAVLLDRERIKNESMSASVDTYKQAMQVSTTFMNPNVWTQIRAMSKVFFEGKALPSSIANEPQLVMVLQAGFEMGMAPVESLKSLYIVNGSINVYGAATVRRLRKHGWTVQYSNESDQECTATVTRKDGITGRMLASYTETFKYADAEKSGYTKAAGNLKVGWKEGLNRKLKMRYGALSLIIKSYIPEVLGSASDIAELAMDAPIDITPQPEQASKNPDKPVDPIKPGSFADRMAEKTAAATTPKVEKTGDKAVEVTKDGDIEK